MIKARKMSATLVAATLCVATAGWTAARTQETSTDQPPIQPAPETTSQPVQSLMKNRCTQLIGSRVQNQQGEKLGTIADVVVNFDNERVSYCVVRVKPGILAKSRLVEVPLAAFRPSADGSILILNANKANLANARGLDPNEWPPAMNPVWGAEPGTPAEAAAPVELAPTEVYAWPGDQPPPTVNQYGQFSCPRTATEGIAQADLRTSFGTIVSPH